MSDEHKPHDDSHADGEAHKHDDAHAAAPETHAEPHVEPAHESGHVEAPAAVEAVSDGHADAAHEEPAHAEPAHEEQSSHDDAVTIVSDAPAHDPHPTPAETATAAAIAGGAAVAAAAPQKRPVWSDQGDAPFEDVEITPVYARGKKGAKKKKSSGGGAANEGWEIFKTIAFALAIAMVLRILLFQPFTIPSASMEPNLYEGDYIVVTKWSYGYSRHSIPFSPPLFEGRIMDRAPQRGDIVVFKLPRDDRTDYIKRLIGMPGDRIQMIDNVLHINGAPVQDVTITGEQLTTMYGQQITQANETLPGGRTFRIQDFGPGGDLDNTPVFEVPTGYYFMMGDNRDNSIDSRVDESAGVGFVPAENLIGKAEIILFSWEPGASLWNPVSWFSKIRPSRFFTVLD
ncbi:hypothetical protein GCM10009422_19980 [Brevundimonas kwangchunensis]|uniref:Signal peptidase I n=1 Tax=Brevundimonas kwangchunensis TaxID=322163 RepID=A0ABN1GYP3_9CAUL